MTIQEMHYDLKLRLDKLDSLNYDNILEPERDIYLNRAQITLIKQRYGLNNLYNAGFEQSQKRVEDLKMLLVKSCNNTTLCESPLIPSYTDNIKGIYTYNLNNLTKGKYLIFSSAYIKAFKKGCEIDITPSFSEHDDLYGSLINPKYKPSFEWMYLPIVFSENYIYAYTNNEFQIGKMFLDYLRYPREMHYGNYSDENGILIPEASCELPDFLHYEILDLAEVYIKKDIESPTTELSYQNLQSNE